MKASDLHTSIQFLSEDDALRLIKASRFSRRTNMKNGKKKIGTSLSVVEKIINYLSAIGPERRKDLLNSWAKEIELDG